MTARPLLTAQDLRVTFDLPAAGGMPWTKPRQLHAVGGVDFTLMPGETLGIVGESGSGKTMTGRSVRPATICASHALQSTSRMTASGLLEYRVFDRTVKNSAVWAIPNSCTFWPPMTAWVS